ncbi:MAG: class I SAM-dependent methyltransferase [Flavobacteriales bacterium]|nr:class I SAM-dependent methyltransferase [Flavobacteriales bacterium]
MKSSSRYIHHESIHNSCAAKVILPEVFKWVNPSSVLDVGCGTGSWLKVARELGVEDYLGIDGPHMDLNKAVIPVERIVLIDLEKPFDLNRRFDLVICLEVAEHISPSSAEDFIYSLCHHSKFVLFSAAIPGQGGQNHLNEQWPSWWQKLFEKNGFRAYDILRLKFWDNEKIFYWYKQNMILYSADAISGQTSTPHVLPLVHPDLFTARALQLKNLQEGRLGIYTGFRVFFNSFYRLFQK